ncbi:MAG: BadF/BadG/BcrA/BcrD ATPase family protein, partial [Acholeplasmataceae bacterium]
MNYYLGIDGGGTKTSVHIIDEMENIIYHQTSGASSIDTVTNEDTLKSFSKALEGFYQSYPKETFKSVFIGLGGIVSRVDEEHVEQFSKALKGITSKTNITARNDMENALYSGLLFDEGMALICGTGMVAFGKNQKGMTHKAGGWSFKEGDLGSSYDLGMRALRYVIQAYDGREQMTNFSKEIASTIGMTSTTDFFHIIQDRYLDR